MAWPVLLQLVPTSDASAEAAVFRHPHTEPWEAPAAGPAPAPALQLHPQWCIRAGGLPAHGEIQLPWGPHGRVFILVITNNTKQCEPTVIVFTLHGQYVAVKKHGLKHVNEVTVMIMTNEYGYLSNSVPWFVLIPAGILHPVHSDQEAPHPPPPAPASEVQHSAVLYQLQRGCTQVIA